MKDKSRLLHIIAVVAFGVFIVLGLSSAASTPDILGNMLFGSSYAGSATTNQRYTAENDFSISNSNFGFQLIAGNRFISAGNITGYKGKATEIKIPPIIERTVVYSIGKRAFYNNQLTSVTIPDMVNAGRINTIDYRVNAFGNPGPDIDGYVGISLILEGAFANNPLTSLILGNGVTVIGEQAFRNNKLTNVIIPDSVTTIGDAAFFGAWDETNNTPLGTITNVTFGNSVTTIGAHAFENNSLSSITIPNSVTSIGDNAFSDNKITNVIISGSVKELGKKIFSGNPNFSITLQNGITSIGDETFADAPISSINIPGSVKTIGNNAFAGSKLTTITIENGVTTIGDQAFANTQISSINIPGSIRTIGKNAFAGSKLTTITIENGITNIGDQAFANLPLTSITIPNSVTHLAGNAFTGTNNLTIITIGPNVTITGNELMPFNFRGAYLENSLRAGTYNFVNGRWSVQFR